MNIVDGGARGGGGQEQGSDCTYRTGPADGAHRMAFPTKTGEAPSMCGHGRGGCNSCHIYRDPVAND